MTTQTQVAKSQEKFPIKALFESPNVKQKLQELLNKNAATFTTSVLQIVNSNSLLRNADPMTVFNAACMAATLQLPLQNGLGFAYIVPYKNNKTGKYDAQFQLGYKGLIQLAQRSGQFKRLVAVPVYEKQLLAEDPINGFEFDWKQKPEAGEQPIGYYAYFRLLNDFTAELYMTTHEVNEHAKRYSQTYRTYLQKKEKGQWASSVWADNFEAMALKGLDVNTEILTTNGFKKMGELTKQDIVFDINGNPTNILAISERKHIDCYKVKFSNGTEIICDEEHDWIVRIDSETVMKKGVLYPKYDTKNIKDLYEAKQQKRKVTIKTACVDIKKADLPIPPYLFGYWLGNGSKSAASVSCDIADVSHICQQISEAGFSVGYSKDKRSNACQVNISRPNKAIRTGGFREILEVNHLLNNKHIPEQYLFSSIEQRVAFIQGLFDADASIDKKRGRITFTQTNENIINSTYDILCSLGETPNKRVSKGFGYGKDVTVYSIQFTPTRNYFTLPRKAERFKEREANNSWIISNIEKCETVETVCIGVESETKSFLASRCLIPTHNTVMKLLLSKQAPLSVEMQQAVLADQAVVKDVEKAEFSYPDNEIQDAEFTDLKVTDEQFAQCKQNIINKETTLQDLCDSGFEFSREQYEELEMLENEQSVSA